MVEAEAVTRVLVVAGVAWIVLEQVQLILLGELGEVQQVVLRELHQDIVCLVEVGEAVMILLLLEDAASGVVEAGAVRFKQGGHPFMEEAAAEEQPPLELVLAEPLSLAVLEELLTMLAMVYQGHSQVEAVVVRRELMTVELGQLVK